MGDKKGGIGSRKGGILKGRQQGICEREGRMGDRKGGTGSRKGGMVKGRQQGGRGARGWSGGRIS